MMPHIRLRIEYLIPTYIILLLLSTHISLTGFSTILLISW